MFFFNIEYIFKPNTLNFQFITMYRIGVMF